MRAVLYQVTMGRSREVGEPDGVERGSVGVDIAVVTVVAVWFGMRLTPWISHCERTRSCDKPPPREPSLRFRTIAPAGARQLPARASKLCTLICSVAADSVPTCRLRTWPDRLTKSVAGQPGSR